jgi:hypothetical protein
MPKSLLAGIVVFAIVGVLIYFAMSGQTAATCEVCIEFNGHTQCRTAKAPTKQEAIRTATDMACAELASGMNESMSCGRTTPKSTKCE